MVYFNQLRGKGESMYIVIKDKLVADSDKSKPADTSGKIHRSDERNDKQSTEEKEGDVNE